MDSPTKTGKTGKVYLQPHKAGKKWKPVWLSLFPPSSSGVGRLEIQDVGGGGTGGGEHGARRLHQHHGEKKVVRLSELISVLRLPPNAEACPMENMSAFCVETQDRTMVFAALRDDCVDWVNKLCLSSFQKGGASNHPHMEENQIYASADDIPEFRIVVQRTDAATRCGLQGSYWLQVGREALMLRETQKKTVIREWPYELLRRYGKDKLALTIEAGRRCESGPGTFTFETQQAEKIFSLIQSSIKRKTSPTALGNQNQESEKVITPNIQAHSPHPKIPDLTSMTAILENTLRTQGRKSPVREDTQEESKSSSAQPAPITLMPLPLVPMQDSPSGGHRGEKSDAVYADPVECIQSVLKPLPTTALYVDPASVLPLKPPGTAITPLDPQASLRMDVLDPEYSEVYDKVGPNRDPQTVPQSKEKMKGFTDEPIYAEPMSEKDKVPRTIETKPDPFAHLYAQVCKMARTPSPSSSPKTNRCTTTTASKSATKTSDEPLDDVIYENLGII